MTKDRLEQIKNRPYRYGTDAQALYLAGFLQDLNEVIDAYESLLQENARLIKTLEIIASDEGWNYQGGRQLTARNALRTGKGGS